MSTFPEILLPVLEAARREPSDVVAKYWHDSPYFILPPHLPRQKFIWMPRRGYVLVILFTVFGRAYPLDPDTLEIDTSFWYENTDAGFWHSGPDMRFHWDPLESSLTDKVYPHLSVVDERAPLSFYLENPTDDWIYFNVTIHIWEMTKSFYESIFRPYLLGVFYHYWQKGLELLRECREKDLDLCLTRKYNEALRKTGIWVIKAPIQLREKIEKAE